MVDAIYTSLVLKGAIFRLGMGSGVELGEVVDDIDFMSLLYKYLFSTSSLRQMILSLRLQLRVEVK